MISLWPPSAGFCHRKTINQGGLSPLPRSEKRWRVLRRLRRDRIDLYQIHWPDPLENLSESWETLQELRKEGKIRWAGVCNCWKEELELLDRIAPVTSNQPMYSMLARDIEPEVLPWCGGKGTGVLVYSPMHSGLLTGKVSRRWLDGLPDNDWRKHKRDHPVVSPLQSEEGMEAFVFSGWVGFNRPRQWKDNRSARGGLDLAPGRGDFGNRGRPPSRANRGDRPGG